MKKYIIKVLFFLTPLTVLSIYVEYSLRSIPNDYSFKKEYLNKNANEIEILILGNSHSFYGIDPRYISKNAFNASHVSQTFKYDNYIFNNVKNELINLKIVIIPISYNSLFSKLEEGKERWRVKNYSIYYGYYSHFNPQFFFEIFNNGKLIELYKSTFKSLFAEEKQNNISVTSLGFGLGYSFKEQQDLNQTGKSSSKRHTKNSFKNLNDNLYYLTEIIEYCKHNDIEVILFTGPTWHTYHNNLDSRQLNEMNKNITQLLKNNKNVQYISFLKDKRFQKEDFYNADHLNEIGSEKFSKILNEIIKN